MNINDLDLAEQCYLLAYELKPSDEIKSTLHNIQQQLTRLEKHKTTVLSKRARHFLEESKTAMQAGKLKQALELYNQIPATEKRHGLVKSYKQELDKRINKNVNDGIEVGRKLYSQGQIEQALAIWNELLALAPNNEYLVSHIERAKRVQEKLLKLRKKDSNEIPQE
jgi:tetratricopeptide (TPR) repeat protein